MTPDVLISLDHIYMGWERSNVLEDISLSVHNGDFIAITGPNGGGKTTLLRILLGLLKPTKGTVRRTSLPLRIGYLPQKNMIDSHFPVTVTDVIRSGLLAMPTLEHGERDRRLRHVIAEMGLEEHAGKPIGQLSGGQLQRALLGRAIIADPQLLVLDEPLSYIDKRFEERLYKLIEKLALTTTIVLVSHEMTTLAGMANRHFIVDHRLHECTAHHHFVHTDCH
ncbi:MAG: ATP-binding cassette domain-containing protein [Bacteroidales bacterium]|nr:ATP-binding cassette domain-containing protein [Bacteroidales bacterium]